MAGLSERLTGAGNGPWLDYVGYAGKLLAGGKVPWTAVDGAMASHTTVAGNFIIFHAEIGAAVLDEHVVFFE